MSDMFLYVIMLNLLKENYVLHAIQLWMIICVVTVCYCEMFGPIFHTVTDSVRWQVIATYGFSDSYYA